MYLRKACLQVYGSNTKSTAKHATQLLNKLALNKCHFLFLEGEKILKQRRMKRKLECDSYISKSGSYMKMHVLMYTFAEVNSEVVLIYK